MNLQSLSVLRWIRARPDLNEPIAILRNGTPRELVPEGFEMFSPCLFDERTVRVVCSRVSDKRFIPFRQPLERYIVIDPNGLQLLDRCHCNQERLRNPDRVGGCTRLT